MRPLVSSVPGVLRLTARGATALLTACGAIALLTACGATSTPDFAGPATTSPAPTSPAPSGDPPTGDPPTGDPPTGDPPTGDPPTGDPPTGDPPSGDPPGTPLAHELTLPASHASSRGVMAYASIEDSHAITLTELSYGLADGYPEQVMLTAQGGYLLGHSCQSQTGPLVWESIADVQGTAAQVTLVAGKLAVELREEGTVTVQLEGKITEQECLLGGVAGVTSVPLRHRFVLHVHRVAGFVVDQFNQQLTGCAPSLVLPSGGAWLRPRAHPLDLAGQRFEPDNAPDPATITLRSSGVLTDRGGGYLSAGPGPVTVSVDTKLPVQGLASFEVVGPPELTSVQAALHLSRAAAKGSVSQPIEEGATYKLFFPEQSNTVEVQVSSALTTRGPLCAGVPGSWFAATSSTPAQCAATAAGDDASASTSVATLGEPGECRLEVTIPGASQQWSTTFRTTP